ncbi:MAG: UDP-2,4-diacetamido-2,4,6-trideoxy-beta-L-altropyranose hydrolase [Saprospiraceae bacterium]|jgi:UDP-2,4-diacetamido-2,4,6-trideoxy-beta-L-altropyranose hydrolase
MGLGHIIRSLALARMLKPHFECHFAIQNPPKNLLSQIKGYADGLIELPKSDSILEEAKHLCKEHLTSKEIVVLDGYHFDTEYQKIIKKSGCQMVCIDDIHDKHFLADAIINHSGGIQKEQYSAEDYTKFYLGLDFVLLRKPFLKAAQNRFQPNAHPIAFVCLGGADPKNDTVQVLRRLEAASRTKQCYVVIGGAYKYRAELENFISKSTLQVTILENICATRMIDVMRLCSLAITSPSTIAIEYLSIGGELYLYQTADNQVGLFNYLIRSQMAFEFKKIAIISPDKRALALKKQIGELDGKSAERLMNIFRELEKKLHYKIRRAHIGDMMTFFNWVNDTQTRKQSFSQKTISLKEHKEWFSNKIFSAQCYLYILEFKGIPVGQIRFDLEEQTVLSYSVASKFRGRGFGTYLLEKGIERIQKDSELTQPIIGYVKKENIASNKTFTRLGFKKKEAGTVSNTFVYSSH